MNCSAVISRGPVIAAIITTFAYQTAVRAQSMQSTESVLTVESPQAMQAHINRLEAEVTELRAMIKSAQPNLVASTPTVAATSEKSETQKPTPELRAELGTDARSGAQAADKRSLLQTADRQVLDFLHDTTINLSLDGYYAYNFNNPVGRVNLLRAYDVLSNEFSLDQASVVIDHPPDAAAGRRWGGRLDLQFGQATDTLQGNPANEPRPQIYRNIFQAYGTYVAPLGGGLTLDVGKWGSSIGIEGNYTKDQTNYSRALWFDFLPFYHMGMRAGYKLNDRLTLNYRLPNETK